MSRMLGNGFKIFPVFETSSSFFWFCQCQFSLEMFSILVHIFYFYFSCVPLVLFYIITLISLVMLSGKHYYVFGKKKRR